MYILYIYNIYIFHIYHIVTTHCIFPSITENVLSDQVSLVAQWWRICLPMQEMRDQALGQEDPLEKEMATQSSIIAQ